MSLKEAWNKPTTTKTKFYSGLIMFIIFLIPTSYLIWYDKVDFLSYFFISCFGAFLGWTIVVYAFRNDFKDQWKKEKTKT